ncbi:hypothetical protein TomMM35A_06570 [Sphingobium sp. TomMM35A]
MGSFGRYLAHVGLQSAIFCAPVLTYLRVRCAPVLKNNAFRLNLNQISTKAKKEQGFTLLEMLVALAVFSLAALALVRLQGVTLRTAADLDSKALGQIVARNLMVEMQTDAAPPWIGSEEGDVENGGRRWHWVRMVKATSDKRLLQVDLTVSGQAGTSPVVLSFVRAVQ